MASKKKKKKKGKSQINDRDFLCSVMGAQAILLVLLDQGLTAGSQLTCHVSDQPPAAYFLYSLNMPHVSFLVKTYTVIVPSFRKTRI